MKRIFACTGFSCAVMLVLLNVLGAEYVKPFSLGLAVLFAVSLALKEYRQAAVVPLCFGSALFACLVFFYMYNAEVLPVHALDGNTLNATFYITDIPEIKNGSYMYTVKTSALNLNGAPQEIKLRLISSKLIEADAYQLIDGSITLSKTGDTGMTSYGYWGKEIFSFAKLNSYTVMDTLLSTPLRALLHLRRDIIVTLYNSVGGNEGAFAAAIVTGNKVLLSPYIISSFSAAGASHLMAVSGLHLTVISGFLFFLLNSAGIGRRACAVLCIIAVVIFAALTGFSKSVTRAAIMLCIMLSGEVIGKKSDALNSLGAAVFIMCLNPFAVTDVGAVLSVVSVLSLCTFSPILQRALKLDKTCEDYSNPFKRIYVSFSNAVIVSFSVILYTAPVMYLFFGYISLIGIIANVLLVTFGSISLVLSFLAYGFVRADVFPALFVFADRTVNKALLSAVDFFASFRYSTVDFSRSFGFVIAGVLILTGMCIIIHKPLFSRVCTVIISVCVVASMTAYAFEQNNNSQLYLTSGGACVICSEDKTVVYGVNSLSDYYSVSNYLKSRRRHIDIMLFDGEHTDASKKLSNTVKCAKIVIPQYYQELVNNAVCDEIIVSSSYVVDISDNFNLKFRSTRDYNYIDAHCMNYRIVVGSNVRKSGDIFVSKYTAYDSKGCIKLTDGDVIYDINSEEYEARRVDLWR